MTVHDIYANSAHDIQHKGQAALWGTNGCTSISKPITTYSTPIYVHGVDNKDVNRIHNDTVPIELERAASQTV